jgi:hypothetical protein
MTFTIDESVISLWPWAAGVTYILAGVLTARAVWRVWRAIPLPSYRKGDDTPLCVQALLIGTPGIFLWPPIAVFWLVGKLVTWRNGE